MSDETYYAVLGISETAAPPEIKSAYREMLKKIHPDTVSTLSTDLKALADTATKEIIEAYSVLSDAGTRRQYDRQLAEHRLRSAPGSLTQPSTGFYYHHQSRGRRQDAAVSIGGKSHNGRRAALSAGFMVFVAAVSCIFILRPSSDTIPSSQSKTSPAAFKVEFPKYSAFPCDFDELISAVDGKPCLSVALGGTQERFKNMTNPGQPDLSLLTVAETLSIRSACSVEAGESADAYNKCLVGALETWKTGPKQPNLSLLTVTERHSIKSACAVKFAEGPAAYNKCLLRELKERSIHHVPVR
jgi:curved DNA-binding protein CbpA